MSNRAGWNAQDYDQQRSRDGELWTEHFTQRVPGATPRPRVAVGRQSFASFSWANKFGWKGWALGKAVGRQSRIGLVTLAVALAVGGCSSTTPPSSAENVGGTSAAPATSSAPQQADPTATPLLYLNTDWPKLCLLSATEMGAIFPQRGPFTGTDGGMTNADSNGHPTDLYCGYLSSIQDEVHGYGTNIDIMAAPYASDDYPNPDQGYEKMCSGFRARIKPGETVKCGKLPDGTPYALSGDRFDNAVFTAGPYFYFIHLYGEQPDPGPITPKIVAALTEVAARAPRP